MSAGNQLFRRRRRGGYIEPFFAGRARPPQRPKLARALAGALTSPIALVIVPLAAVVVMTLLF